MSFLPTYFFMWKTNTEPNIFNFLKFAINNVLLFTLKESKDK